MIAQLKDIREMLPETIDYLLMNKDELIAREERTAELLSVALKGKSAKQKISADLERSLIAGLQYDTLDWEMKELKKKNRVYYDHFRKEIREKEANAKINLDYLEKAISFSLVKEMKACCEAYKIN